MYEYHTEDFVSWNTIRFNQIGMDLNKFGNRAYRCALRRGKIHENLEGDSLMKETTEGLLEEVHEVIDASETEMSEHLDKYPAIVEELADVAIVAITELYRRGVDIESVLHEKMKYNERR